MFLSFFEIILKIYYRRRFGRFFLADILEQKNLKFSRALLLFGSEAGEEILN